MVIPILTGSVTITHPDGVDTGTSVQAHVQPETGGKPADGQVDSSPTYRVFLPAGTDVRFNDRIRWDGLLLQVLEQPARWPSPFGGAHHVEAIGTVMPEVIVDVLRGSVENEFGDLIPDTTPVLANVPVWLTEQSQTTFVPADQRTTVIRKLIGLVPPDTDVRERDRLRLEDGVTYLVEAVTRPHSPVERADLRLDLRLVEPGLNTP
ncbi:hypothetical protein A4E84_29775 [Streptomyces qaidamensis]|uniref:Uncharacterized protein n=1 Tax=Streptomyces qaidamensis TaxID=1783515 RepID=A0A143C7A3_9ACTN|nr:hypothetical protein [Streptomyces qaidamensis]AMW13317.1 hypothetical protein A4E84_29775 [Streptomyces qaidamensis]